MSGQDKIYYYHSKHLFECGRDTYYHVIPEHNLKFKDKKIVWGEMVWDSDHDYPITTKMVSYKESGIEEELLRLKKIYDKKEEEKSKQYIEATLERFEEEDKKRRTGGSYYW